jgi:hypothetical protein
MVAAEPNEAALGIQLQNIIMQRLSNLKSITIEDRPSDPLIPDFRSSMGSAELHRLVGLDLRWNGPYASPPPWPTAPLQYPSGLNFPYHLRAQIYAAVFAINRATQPAPELKIIMRGYRRLIQTLGLLPHGIFRYDTAADRSFLEAHLKQLTVHRTGMFVNPGSWFDQLRAFVLSRGIALVGF